MLPTSVRLIVLIGIFCFELKAQIQPAAINPLFDQANHIRSYLNTVAGAITYNSLADVTSLSQWQSQREQRVSELVEMLGLQDHSVLQNRIPPPVTITGVMQQDGYRIVKLYYQSQPDLYVPANLYIPDSLSQPAPAILYVCGHSHTQKHHYQSHARSFAENGFVCLIIETIQRGEVKGEHLGAESLGWFHWYSKGYNPGGVEVWNGIRGIDLLCQLPEVDTSRIGVTGISGGGSQSWYLPAIDPRIKGAVAVDGAATVEGQICQRTIDDHCDCMMPVNTYGIDFSDIGALIAPRPFVIAQTTDDGYYSIEAVRALYDRMNPIYNLYGRSHNLRLIEAPGGHGYGNMEEFRPWILSFFSKN
ncbi:MAG: acetylxylan esterase [Saprospiraceae bacterium]|nr:acetylxylan esterase [Saprospiraceae bacterium]